MPDIDILRGPDAIRPAIRDVAELRLRVFREWPYLYDGTMEEEETYLSHFAQSEHACIGLARDGDKVIGATTAEPMPATHEGFRAPLETAGLDISKIYYFGESILLSIYRGQGIGHAFFDLRENAARDWGAEMTAFCAVQRPADHPARPADYRPLDAFWKKRGYAPRPDLICHFPWTDVGDAVETSKPLMFWIKTL
ncbi:MAG: GNAT family N-acetyltransferase [Ponticaulis sp.]|nr:GNAT family N-acetyltransferase [Ponticaulis sp.]